MKKIEEKELEIIIDKQFEIAWIDMTYKKLNESWESKEQWFLKYKTTEDKHQEFKEWLTAYIKKNFPHVKFRIKKEVEHIFLNYGLSTKQKQ